MFPTDGGAHHCYFVVIHFIAFLKQVFAYYLWPPYHHPHIPHHHCHFAFFYLILSETGDRLLSLAAVPALRLLPPHQASQVYQQHYHHQFHHQHHHHRQHHHNIIINVIIIIIVNINTTS